MQCAIKLRKPIHGLMVCEKYIGVLVAENPNPQFLDSRYDRKCLFVSPEITNIRKKICKTILNIFDLQFLGIP